MTETKVRALPPRIVNFEDLELSVQESDTGLLYVAVGAEEGLEPIAEAQFSEDYNLGFDESRNPLNEEGVFSISDVQNYSGPKGIATKLIKFGLEEAKRRGLSVGRAHILNPRIVTIIENLVAQGLIQERHYFNKFYPSDSNENNPPTSELLLQPESSPQQALEFLQADEETENFERKAVVDCVIKF